MIKQVIKLMVVLCSVTIAGATEYFVSGENGNDENAGDIEQPFKTISVAMEKLVPGDILYIRQGTYRESLKVNIKATAEKPIVIRNYQSEIVTIKGSDLFNVSDFVQIDMPGFDANSDWAKKRGLVVKAFKKDNFPVNPSQVFINGKSLAQVGDDATAVALDGNWTRLTNGSEAMQMRRNSFFYDKETKALYIRPGGNNFPKDAVVEISMRQSLLTIGKEGEYIHIIGLNFMHTSTLGNSYGGKAVTIRSNCTLESSTIKWCAGIGVDAGGKNPKVIDCELAFNGNDGFNSNSTEDFLVSKCLIHHNNYRDYNPNWHTGGLKIIPDANGTIEYCKVYDNYGYGIWFDSNRSGRPIIIRGNTVSGNIGGVYLELSHNVLLENNFIIYNTYFAVQAVGSDIVVRGNTIANNSGYCSLGFLPRKKKEYRSEDQHCKNNVIENNLFMDNRTRIEIHLPAKDEENDVENFKCDNNSFVRIGGSKFRYTSGPVGGEKYRDIFDNGHFSTWKRETGFDKNSYYWEGNFETRYEKNKK
jgi:parallel beta-helix repeat protein